MQKKAVVHSEIQVPVFNYKQELWAVSNMENYTFVEEVLFIGISLKMLPVGEYDEPLLVVVSKKDAEVLRVPLKTVFKNRQDAYKALDAGELDSIEILQEKLNNVVAFAAER